MRARRRWAECVAVASHLELSQLTNNRGDYALPIQTVADRRAGGVQTIRASSIADAPRARNAAVEAASVRSHRFIDGRTRVPIATGYLI